MGQQTFLIKGGVVRVFFIYSSLLNLTQGHTRTPKRSYIQVQIKEGWDNSTLTRFIQNKKKEKTVINRF